MPESLTQKIRSSVFFVSLIVAVGLCLVLGATIYIKDKQHESELRGLRNLVAMQEKTIEVSSGLFEKTAQEHGNLIGLLDDQREESKKLKDDLKKRDGDVIALNELVVRWKDKYYGAVNAHQTDSGPPISAQCEEECKKKRSRVDIDKDFGVIGVKGYTLTNPAEGYIEVEQKKPLVIGLAIVKGSDGKWKSVVSTSDGYKVDVKVSGVDMSPLKTKWYEKVGVNVIGGVGQGGAYAAVGPSLDVGPFSFSVNYGRSTESSGAFYGASVAWRPFKKSR